MQFRLHQQEVVWLAQYGSKTKMSSLHNFVDYFAICGLDVGSGLEPDKLSGN